MNDRKNTERMLERYLDHLDTPEGAEVDSRILTDALTTMQKTKQSAAHDSRITWRTIMTSKKSKLAAAAVIIMVVLSLTVFDGLTRPAWALEDAIAALKNFGAVHLVWAFPGGTAEVWMRANPAQSQSTDVIVKGSHGAITWTKEGSTYHYEPDQNTVYYEHALTVGMAQWLGPDLLEMLSKAQDAEVTRGRDSATGRDRVVLRCSLIDVHGAQSWTIEFDAASKLPVAMKQWQNLDRSGPPAFDAFKITYFEDLPDSIFDVQIPGQPTYVQKVLTVPEETIGLLSDSDDGIAAEGMTQQEAAQRVVRATYEAIIDGDLETLKKMCPLCQDWGDEFLQNAILRPGKDERVVEILNIGSIEETGHSTLGALVALPASLRLQNGAKVKEKMIVQFRQLGSVRSCVLYGPYGIPREIE